MPRASASARFFAMKTAGTHHFIERTYREGSQFQWVRESYVNAKEAHATRIEFGIEWQAVESQGVYRRMIADNGCGMTGEQLVEFFNTFGGSGKPIGGAHENFGVGAKTSLLPWNHYGVVVISWVDGDASMIWVTRDAKSEEYGLKLETCAGPLGETLEGVYDPYDDPEHGCNWATIKPSWIEDHGTVVVLLGNTSTTDTILGDPTRSEADTKGISSFLNRRVWAIPDGVEVFVDELRGAEKANWPKSEKAGHDWSSKNTASEKQRTNMRRISGAKFFIEYPEARVGAGVGKLGAKGTVPLRDGTEIDWYLWDGERPAVHSYAAKSGYIAALYNDELYDIAAHHSTYRSFGISENAVRQRLWLIARPPVDPEGKRGVYPRTDRNSLLIKGGKEAGGPLPFNEWATEFADNMPDELVEALRSCRHGETGALTDDEWRDKLAERFGARWRIPRLRAKKHGTTLFDDDDEEPAHKLRKPKTTTKVATPTTTEKASSEKTRQPRTGTEAVRIGKSAGTTPGESSLVNGGLPRYRPVGAADVGEGILAAWQPKDPDHPEGTVLLNTEHPVLRSIIEHWQSQYADHHTEEIEKDVIAVYGQVAVSKVAHSEHLKGILPAQTVETLLRSDEALTMSLLGLMAEDHLIATKIGGKYSKKRFPVAEKRKAPRPGGASSAPGE